MLPGRAVPPSHTGRTWSAVIISGSHAPLLPGPPSVIGRWHQKYRRPRALERLNQFYVEIGPLISRKLPKNDAVAFEAYRQDADTWPKETAKWIADNLGGPAQARFLDTTGLMDVSYSQAVSEQHNKILLHLTRLRENLSALIENDAWR
jgi:hypothetical protein